MSQLSEFGNFDPFVKRTSLLVVVAILLLTGGYALLFSLAVVGQKKAAVLVRKTGRDLPDGAIIAPDPSYKGVQLATLGEGWHFRNPLLWDWEIVDQVEVPEGKLGVRIRQWGESVAPGQILAGPGQKGIVEEVLRPGRYRINPYAETVELHDAVFVPEGHVGVVAFLAGGAPASPNQFLVREGERGVQSRTLPSGLYYLNPYARQVTPIDVRSQKFDMSDENSIRFPSLDGFTITMEGTIEWHIDRDRVAEVFVKYVDERPVIQCVVEKIILPNARSFSRLQGSRYLARELLGGESRQRFQEDFLEELSRACIEQGIVIREAVVRNIVLPDRIAGPIRDRELAVRQRDKYAQEKQRERTEKELAMRKKLEERQRHVTEANAQVAVDITDAERQRDVALIQANRALEVARLELEAADNQAKAVLLKGQAEADVVRFQNKAAARGIADARKAFGAPDTYVRYLLYSRLAPAFHSILANTDSPFVEIFRNLASGPAPAGAASAPPPAARPSGSDPQPAAAPAGGRP